MPGPFIQCIFPKKTDSFIEAKTMENICKPVSNSTPHGTGIKDKQILFGKMHVQLFWPFDFSPILLCSDDPERENSALNSAFGSVFFFLTWIFIYSYSKGVHVLVFKRHDFYIFISGNHC